MESTKYNKLVNKQKRSRLTDIENKLVVTNKEWEGEGQYRDSRLRDMNYYVQNKLQGYSVQYRE